MGNVQNFHLTPNAPKTNSHGAEESKTSWGRSYGGQRVPLAFKTGKMTPPLLQHIREGCSFLTAPEAQLMTDPSFKRCIDHPELPSHRYYEGYFHALATSKDVVALNPRLGNAITKKAAPLPLRALCEFMRRQITPALIDNLKTCSETNEMAVVIIKLLNDGCAFSDLAVQVHAGEEVNAEHVGWHTDAPNSVLHMALSLGRGCRALHSRRSLKGNGPETETEHVVEWLSEGDTYISSPSCFELGVQYDRSLLWSNRIIAIQCRFPIGEDRNLLKFFSGEDFTEVMTKVEAGLDSQPLRLPSKEELSIIEEELTNDV
jgi:hypothetical protein